MADDAQRHGFFQRLGASFQEKLQTGRAVDQPREAVVEPSDMAAQATDEALRRAKPAAPRRMLVPEGVTINGSVTSSAEAELSGRIEGDVTVDGRLYLGPSAHISGNVRAVACKIEGLVEGKMECSQEIELGRTGRLNADAIAAKRIVVAGQIFGNVTSGGMLQLVASGRIEGNIMTRQLVIEEGATFNGKCSMRVPAQRSQK